MFDYHKINNATATMFIEEYNLKLPYGKIKLNKKKLNQSMKSLNINFL